MVASFAKCSGNGIVSYYFVPVLQNAGINGGFQIFNWLMVILASLFVDKVGRRKLFLGSSIGMLVTLIAVAICNERFLATGNKSAGYCMIPFPFLFNGSHDFAYFSLPTLYTAEIHPCLAHSTNKSIRSLLKPVSACITAYSMIEYSC